MKTLIACAALAASMNCLAGLSVDFGTAVGPVKPVHGVGQPPLAGGPGNYWMIPYLKHAGVPFSRLHDVGGAYGGSVYVDIPNVFPDFDADETLPENYAFEFTDKLLEALAENEVEPFFRLGVTIENFQSVRRRRLDPPKDFAKWARICEHVVRHYTEGWANGYRMNIRHWEIWNEPDSKPDPEKSLMWHGTWDEYCRLYEVASKHLKGAFPHLKIGGYGACGFYYVTGKPMRSEDDRTRFPYYVKCFDEFLAYVRDKQCPLDYFSWHFYDAVSNAAVHAKYVRDRLDKYGFQKTESSLDEWMTTAPTASLDQAVEVAAMLLVCQNGPVDSAMIYDGRCGMGRYSPLFDPVTYNPRLAYWSLKAFNELYVRGNAVKCVCDIPGVYAAAADRDGDGALMVVNLGDKSVPFEPDLGAGRRIASCRAITFTYAYQDAPVPKDLPAKSVYLFTVSR